jgi:putative nucleotidyltransferase with HDIG domain
MNFRKEIRGCGWPGESSAAQVSSSARMAAASELERSGRLDDALATYELAVDSAEEEGNSGVLAESLRRAANIYRRRHEMDEAVALYLRSQAVAEASEDSVLVAEALNGLALVHFQRGEWEDARSLLRVALQIGCESEPLHGRIEQNLGVMANIEGDVGIAIMHYERSLRAFRASSNERGCAIAFHNLGMASADKLAWDEAQAYFQASLEVADTTGDVNLRGHVLLNRTEVDLARGRYEDARRNVEEALQIFTDLGATGNKASAYKFLGMLYRETGRPMLAESRFQTALELAEGAGASLVQAEASHELAVLYEMGGRNLEALKSLNASHRLFNRLNARRDLVDVASKVSSLEAVYLRVVREWGQSIESADSYTFGHSARVGEYATTLAKTMGIAADELTAVRIGAYLHDLGKVRVPHEILNKPGRLEPGEMALMQLHPQWGLEMLAGVEFPWDIRGIIRSHHEKIDGSGYPDRLRGDEISDAAQLICVVDVFDALTTTRSYRSAMARERAITIMHESRHWWRRDIYEAFLDCAPGQNGTGIQAA